MFFIISYFNPNSVGVKYSLIVWGGQKGHVFVLTSLLVKSFYFGIFHNQGSIKQGIFFFIKVFLLCEHGHYPPPAIRVWITLNNHCLPFTSQFYLLDMKGNYLNNGTSSRQNGRPEHPLLHGHPADRITLEALTPAAQYIKEVQ